MARSHICLNKVLTQLIPRFYPAHDNMYEGSLIAKGRTVWKTFTSQHTVWGKIFDIGLINKTVTSLLKTARYFFSYLVVQTHFLPDHC